MLIFFVKSKVHSPRTYVRCLAGNCEVKQNVFGLMMRVYTLYSEALTHYCCQWWKRELVYRNLKTYKSIKLAANNGLKIKFVRISCRLWHLAMMVGTSKSKQFCYLRWDKITWLNSKRAIQLTLFRRLWQTPTSFSCRPAFYVNNPPVMIEQEKRVDGIVRTAEFGTQKFKNSENKSQILNLCFN